MFFKSLQRVRSAYAGRTQRLRSKSGIDAKPSGSHVGEIVLADTFPARNPLLLLAPTVGNKCKKDRQADRYDSDKHRFSRQ